MKLQLTKIVEDRSPVVVTRALEKSLKREAWEIRRHDNHMVALGFGPSRNAVNLSDKATFDIDSSEGATTVQVEAEYQYTWFLSEEAQNDTLHSRIESVFATMRAELDLAPEGLNAPSEVDNPPLLASQITTPSDASIESVAPPIISDEYPEPAQLTPAVEVEKLSEEPSIAAEPQEDSKYIAAPPVSARRFGFTAVPLSIASLVVALCVTFGISHFKTRPISHPATKPVPYITTATPTPVPSSTTHPIPPSPLPAKANTPPTDITPPNAQSKDLRRWLEQWAASERTRDANAQASFYADDVRPYLSLDRATRDAVLQDKQNAIQNRKGLWTFKIEHIAIQSQTPDEASVLLKKLVMTQSGSVVRVSEQRISSFLTLKRTQDGWQITGERDFR